MAKQEESKKQEIKEKREEEICKDKRCPIHGSISVRGRIFSGHVTRIIGTRARIEWERLLYVSKYERYEKRKSKIHAHIPQCLADKVKIGSYVEARECRPLSKIMHSIIIKVVK